MKSVLIYHTNCVIDQDRFFFLTYGEKWIFNTQKDGALRTRIVWLVSHIPPDTGYVSVMKVVCYFWRDS